MFQIEAGPQVQNIFYKNEFDLHENKNWFHKKDFALNLVLKQGQQGKWPTKLPELGSQVPRKPVKYGTIESKVAFLRLITSTLQML